LKLYVDSGNVEEIASVQNWLPIEGVTLNPTIVSKEKTKLITLLDEILTAFSELNVHVQVLTKENDDIYKQALKIFKYNPEKLFIKIPATQDGLLAMKRLKTQNQDIKITATTIYNVCQAIVAAKYGVDYVAPYVSHIEKHDTSGIVICKHIKKAINNYELSTDILAASVKKSSQIRELASMGIKAITLSPQVYNKCFKSKATEQDEDEFIKEWLEVFAEKTINSNLK